jgi:hypothetical protein
VVKETFGPLSDNTTLNANQVSHFGLGFPCGQQQDDSGPSSQSSRDGRCSLPVFQRFSFFG